MKKILVCLLSLFVIGCLAGCMRFDATIEIQKNGKANLEMIYAALADMGDGATTSDDELNDSMKELEEKGWKCEKYDQDGYIGFKARMEDLSLEDAASNMGGAEEGLELGSSDSPISITKDGSNYTFDWKALGDADDEGTEDEDTSQYKTYFDQYNGYMRFNLKLPYKPKEHNAHQVSEDGKTLTWNLLEMKKGDSIHVVFSLSNWTPLIIGLIIALVVIIGIIVAVILMNKKKNAPAAFGSSNGGSSFGPLGGPAPYEPQGTNDYGQPSQGPGMSQPDFQAGPQFGQPGPQDPGMSQPGFQAGPQFGQPGPQDPGISQPDFQAGPQDPGMSQPDFQAGPQFDQPGPQFDQNASQFDQAGTFAQPVEEAVQQTAEAVQSDIAQPAVEAVQSDIAQPAADAAQSVVDESQASYEQQMKEYEEKMAIYQQQMKEYEEQKAAYEQYQAQQNAGQTPGNDQA